MADATPKPAAISVFGKPLSGSAVLVALVLALLVFDIADRRLRPNTKPGPAPVVAHAQVKAAASAYAKALPTAYRAVEARLRAGTLSAADPKAIGQAIGAELHDAGKALSDATVADPDKAGAMAATADAMEAR